MQLRDRLFSRRPLAPAGERLPVPGLLALGAGVFLAQTAEFLPGGLVPLIAEDLGVALDRVGWMISIFALTVVVSATPLSILFSRIGRKHIVVLALGVVALMNLGVAISPDFTSILLVRFVGALAHALFWSVVATYVVDLVPRDKLGQGMAYTAVAGSAAAILGIPLGNALGQAWGWRAAFAVVAVVGALVSLILWRWLPSVASAPIRSRPGRDHARRWDPSATAVAAICGLILILVLGQTSFGPYTTTWLERVAGLERPIIPVYLLITGIAGAVGSIAAGRLHDHFPRATFAVASALLALSMGAYPAVAASGSTVLLVAVAVVSSLAFSGLPMMLQMRMMLSASPQLRRTAGAVQTTVFNLGIGGGAVLGGLVLTRAGIEALPWVPAIGAMVTGVLAAAWDVVRRRVARADRLSP